MRDRLLNPIVDKKILENRYQIIEDLMTTVEFDEDKNNSKLYHLIEEKLNKVIDLERAHRRMSLEIFQPTDIFGIKNSYENIISIVKLIDMTNLPSLNQIKLSEQDTCELNQLYQDIVNDFNLDECIKYHQDKIYKQY